MAQLHGPRRNSAMEPVFEPAVAEMSRPVHARTALSLFIGLGSAKVGQASQIANIKRGWANWHTLPEWAAARVPTPLIPPSGGSQKWDFRKPIPLFTTATLPLA
jgi:hypothetical protein